MSVELKIFSMVHKYTINATHMFPSCYTVHATALWLVFGPTSLKACSLTCEFKLRGQAALK